MYHRSLFSHHKSSRNSKDGTKYLSQFFHRYYTEIYIHQVKDFNLFLTLKRKNRTLDALVTNQENLRSSMNSDVENSKVSLSPTLDREEKAKHHIRKKTCEFIDLRFLVKVVSILCMD
ncbi:hypothetical protein V8G54_013040 [Vigna mungo]|uniref:Uncharacterized protein n=1 Tax=Vigna mungo TaxID=3915 RepID=A0AAQ3S159_VIGMU